MKARRPVVHASVRFPPRTGLQSELRRRIDAYFEATGKSTRGGGGLVAKSALMGAWAAASWLYLLFGASGPVGVVVGGASLGAAIAGIGFNVMHDGGHGSFSRSRFLNRLSAWAGDLVGGSSYLWHHKHNILHHTATNVDGVDDDLDAEPFLRLSPLQRRRWYHRFQHLYVWVLYGFLLPKWQVWDDVIVGLIRGRVGPCEVPRPKGKDLVLFVGGKLLFFGWALVVPALLHPILNVLVVYAYVAVVAGVILGSVFQLAHCVQEAEFHAAPDGDAAMPRSWMEHQLATTVNFCPRNRLLTWYLGGLNFQVEHHLFPRISHVHYPRIAGIVREVCAEFDVPYLCHERLRSAVASHVRFLRELGGPARALDPA